jgi:hypothetical protein
MQISQIVSKLFTLNFKNPSENEKMVDYLREKIDLNILVDYSNTLFTNSKL